MWLRSLFCVAILLSSIVAQNYANDSAVKIFQQYIQINTTSGNDLTPAVNFWLKLATEQGLYTNVYWFTDGYPIVVIKWPGLNSTLGSIMLNSHMDVVPADENDGWTYPPFSGYLDNNSVIWGRGAQDMKSVTIQYYEALKRLKARNITLLRDVYMTLMPDEETGAENGMVPFVASEEFKALNVALELDEGTSYDLPVSPVFYQDKAVWQIRVDCHGVATHGSSFAVLNTTAIGKCSNVINTFLALRDQEYEKSLGADITNSGSYTSINLNKINGGTANNIVPQIISLVFDVRLATTVNETLFEAQLREWIRQAGDNITLTFLQKDSQSPATIVGAANPYWTAFSKAASTKGFIVLPTIPPGSTDARFMRSAGFPAFGFSPMPNTELLLHAVNERLSVKTFLAGIEVYEQIIYNLANLPGEETSVDPSVYLYYTSQ
ncbi:aminoacylase-1B-like [Hyposmocoma kahamanoa]|uniref:aminoacylase-1B-like n=1 Tax=Hyposmocoma kahamanoa TaxID=1477025 RepID=UPI000E6D5CFE|nr:aminoacylase-1B-like [Hyposmocoma kahamanoa]